MVRLQFQLNLALAVVMILYKDYNKLLEDRLALVNIIGKLL